MNKIIVKLSEPKFNIQLKEPKIDVRLKESKFNIQLKESKFNIQLKQQKFIIKTGLTGPRGFGGTLQQGTGYIDETYLYVVYGIDLNWEAIRNTRDLLSTGTTGIQIGTKPTTLAEVQGLIYT